MHLDELHMLQMHAKHIIALLKLSVVNNSVISIIAIAFLPFLLQQQFKLVSLRFIETCNITTFYGNEWANLLLHFQLTETLSPPEWKCVSLFNVVLVYIFEGNINVLLG